MRILLTGATGYLGSRLCKRLLKSQHDVACIVRNLENLRELVPVKEQITLIQVPDVDEDVPFFAPEVVIHTACVYARGGHSDLDILEGNLFFPYKLMQAVKKFGIRRWINTATSLPPMLDAYSLSKNQLAQWGDYYAKIGAFEFINVVLEHFYGPGAPEDQFLTWVIKNLITNKPLDLTLGTQKRDFIYIEDVLDVYEKLLISDLLKTGETSTSIGVGTGIAPSIREVVEYLKRITNSDSELNFGAVLMRRNEPDSHCDVTRINNLGINPINWKKGMLNLLPPPMQKKRPSAYVTRRVVFFIAVCEVSKCGKKHDSEQKIPKGLLLDFSSIHGGRTDEAA